MKRSRRCELFKMMAVRGKLWGDDAPVLLRAADVIRSALAPNLMTSDLRDSREGGYHVMITFYLNDEAEPSEAIPTAEPPAGGASISAPKVSGSAYPLDRERAGYKSRKKAKTKKGD